jgi:hypothetical protein
LDVDIKNPPAEKSSPAPKVISSSVAASSADTFSKSKAAPSNSRDNAFSLAQEAKKELQQLLEQQRIEDERRRRMMGGGGGGRKADFGTNDSFFYSLFAQNWIMNAIKDFTKADMLADVLEDFNPQAEIVSTYQEITNPVTRQLKMFIKKLQKMGTFFANVTKKTNKTIKNNVTNPVMNIFERLAALLAVLRPYKSEEKTKSLRGISFSTNREELEEKMDEMKERFSKNLASVFKSKEENDDQANSAVQSMKTRLNRLVAFLFAE